MPGSQRPARTLTGLRTASLRAALALMMAVTSLGAQEVREAAAMVDAVGSTGDTLEASGRASLAPGARVRITTPVARSPVTGWVDRIDSDTVFLVGKKGRLLPGIPLSSVTRLEVKRREGTEKKGIAPGAVVGGLFGGAIGLAAGRAGEPDCRRDEFLCFKGLSTAAGLSLGLTIGVVAGGLIGWAASPSGWVDVPLRPLQVGARTPAVRMRLEVR